MTSLDKAGQRAAIRLADERDLARDLAGGGAGVPRQSLEDPIQQPALILDGLRRRPRYFDGRFLTGADLTRDQDYVRQRQADMARAGGAGVITGLHVGHRPLSRGQTLSISPGIGLTPAGEVVMVRTRRDVPLLDVPTSRQLDAALGLAEEPRVPLGRRSGLFVLALRPVEFTANPIASYPRSISGKRTVEDGDIIEAAAITLIPYPDLAGAANIMDARRRVARAIFAGAGAALPQEALPLAMLAIDRGTVRWVDAAMVRRETGSDSGVHAAFGSRPRAIAEAFVLQHQSHLEDILADFAGRGLAPIFPAASVFSMLPPVGQMPAAALRSDELGFTQIYFPAGIDADLAFVPADEIAVLADEALTLPPIDLDASSAELDAMGVTIMIPVDRPRYQRLRGALDSANLALAGTPANPAPRGAFDHVATIVARRKAGEAAAKDSSALASAEAEKLRIKAWQAAFSEALSALPQGPGGAPLVWYTRRRSIAQQPRITGAGIAVGGDDVSLNAAVNANIDRLNLARRLAAINGEATPQATVRLMTLLASPTVASSDVMTVSVLSDIEKVIDQDLPAVEPDGGEPPTPPEPEPTPAPEPAPAPASAPTPTPAPSPTPTASPAPSPTPEPRPTPRPFPRPRPRPPILTRPLPGRATIGLATLAQPRLARLVATGETPPTARPERITPAGVTPAAEATAELAAGRPGLARVAVADAAGASTAAREDTPLKLGEGEVLDIAEDYADPHVGEGIERAATAIGGGWPSVGEATWLGESGRALPVDAAFRSVGEERLGDFADLLRSAIASQDGQALDELLRKLA